ncbi:hypothetical protein AB5I41_08215 [Sphingomonas sp. MMS24-JH45]
MIQAAPNAGRARDRAMRLGEHALEGSGLLLTTDADSVPAVDWLQAMVAALGHADVVAGKVVRTVTRPHPAQDRLERYYEALYATRRSLDPVDWEAAATHHQTSGANLGLSVRHYRALGGFMPVPAGEDAEKASTMPRARACGCGVIEQRGLHLRPADGPRRQRFRREPSRARRRGGRHRGRAPWTPRGSIAATPGPARLRRR